MLRILPVLLVLALMIYAFVDCLNTPEEEVRGLPKVVWIIIILVFGEILVGPLVWLFAGRRPVPAGGARPSAPAPSAGWVAPDDNPAFLSSLKPDGTPADGGRADKGPAAAAQDEAMLKEWEADLRRREEELRRKEKDDDSGDA
jgi:phospholipase D-like protein